METGLVDSDKELENRSGRMGLSTLENGRLVKLTGKESSFIRTEIIMKATGAITRLVDMAFTSMRTETSMKANGRMTSSMGMEKNDGQMGHHIKDHIIREPSMALVCINGMMDLSTTATGTIML